MEKHMALGKIDRLLDRSTICTSLSVIVSFVERLELGAWKSEIGEWIVESRCLHRIAI
jgi:hypothetical protein